MPRGMPMMERNSGTAVMTWPMAIHKQKPDHVCKGNADIIAAGFCHHRAPERPEGVAGHAETSDPEGDGDNEHIHNNPGDGIADG